MYRKVLIAITVLFLIVASSQFALAAQIRLSWDANTESDLAGYKVYYGTSSKSYSNSVDVGNETVFALTGLVQGNTYYLVVIAYDTSNNESGFSNEVSGVASELTPPNPAPTPVPTPPLPTPVPTPPSPTPPSPEFCANSTSNKAASMYIAGYDPNTDDGVPIGNIKKYEVSLSPQVGEVVDSAKTPILDRANQIKSSAHSFWSSFTDGNKVGNGGVGEVLVSRTKPRNLFTYLGDSNLSADSNAFDISNDKITPELLGLASGDEMGKETLVQFIHGFELKSRTKGKLIFAKRKWILGAIVNSRPLVVPYCNNSRSVIFVGANDGMLHAFDDITGEELWGFIPTELLGRLKDLTQGNQLKWYVDGSPKVHLTDSQKILIFGLKKGGSNYYGLDVTDPLNPKFLWKIGPETAGYSELAQTWSTPQIGKIRLQDGEKVVFFIGGGYDKNQNRKRSTQGEEKGRAIYATDILTGTQVWRWDFQKDPNMKYSIPSDISCVDTNGDGYIDRLYVGDNGGKLWRFDIEAPDPNAWSGKILFDSNTGVAGGRRKIFYRPDVTLEKGYEVVFLGTGDRDHPYGTKVVDRIYAIKDKGLNTTLSESDLENVTEGVNKPKNIEERKGWFINLNANPGEKVLSSPILMFGVAYFTTYTPSPDGSDGVARIYALNYKNGSPILDLNPANNTEGVKIDLSDRSKIIGKGIPSGTSISAVKGKPVAFTGIEGGIYNTPLRGHSTIIPIWWKEVRKDK